MLTLISTLREEAKLLRVGGNNEDAALLEQAQQVLIAQLSGQGAPTGQSPNGDKPGGIPSTGINPQTQQLLDQLGISVAEEA